MDLQQLRYFTAVAANGSISAAAVVLGVTQPTISQALQGLEHEMRTPLFSRLGRGMVLTSAGHALLAPARRVIRASAVARSSLHGGREGLIGRLDLSVAPAAMSGLVPKLIAQFMRANVGVTTNVRTLDRGVDVLRLFDEQVSDVVFTSQPFDLPDKDDHPDLDLALLEIGSDEVRIAIPRDADGSIHDDKTVRAVLTSRTGSYAAQLAEHDLTSARHRVGPAIVTARRETRLALAVHGVGATFLPAGPAETARLHGVATEALDPPVAYRFAMVYDTATVSDVALAFIESVRGALGSPNTMERNAPTAAAG